MQPNHLHEEAYIGENNWNALPKPLPPRSRLYAIEPIHMNSPNVEGLVSYICRLAEAHHVSPGVLIKQEILPNFRERYTVGSHEIYQIEESEEGISVATLPKLRYFRNPNAYGLLAFQYIKGLESLVRRQHLQSLVIPFGKNWSHHEKLGFARETRAWCPKCLQEHIETCQIVYEPMFWSISAVVVCPFHKCALQSRCPHCLHLQHPFTNRMQVGRCSNCFTWLYPKPKQPLEEKIAKENLDWHLFVSKEILKAIAIHPNSIGVDAAQKISARLSQETKKISLETPLKPQEELLGSLMSS